MSDARPHDEHHIPRPVILATACLLVFIFSTVALIRLTTEPAPPAPVTSAAMTHTRDLAFRDNPEGGISVWDIKTDSLATTIVPGEGGFIRGVLRALARERRTNGIGAGEAPFRLTAFADGRLSIEDLATGRVIDINAFGPDNARAFATLLSAKGDLS